MTRNECAALFRDRDHFCILTHDKPDGDTLGTAVFLCLGLRKLGKQAFLLENPQVPELLAPLCRDLTVPEPAESATLISVDVAAPNMLPPTHQDLLPRIVLKIDHHGSGTPFGQQQLVDPTAGACAEILYDVLALLDITPDPRMAEALYTAISTDTGCFRFANTTAHTFQVAAVCLEAGLNPAPINQAHFESISLNKLRVQAWVTEHTQFFADGKAALCVMPEELAETLRVSQEDTGGMAGFLRAIEGVCMAATIRYSPEEACCVISMRAVPGYNAAAVCEVFGGGGHKGAAGGSIALPLQEAASALMTEMKKQFEEGC